MGTEKKTRPSGELPGKLRQRLDALVESTLGGQRAIPRFDEFCDDVRAIYQDVAGNNDGAVATYIPELAGVDPERFAVALCTVDGQRFSLGDATVPFCLQSTYKPIGYCIALEEHGEDVVHRYVGREPSGRGFNELTLDHEGRPHNPMINAGAIMCCALTRPELDAAGRFKYVQSRWRAVAGGARVGFDNAVYLSERETGDRNFALGYFMREHKAFPENTDLMETLDLYFQCCSLELDAQGVATAAATLAGGGVCPTSGERVLEPRTVQNCLSLMSSCGMYDFSGEFAFSIGLPAKSGVSGALMIVVPNVLGICTWSPRLDRLGNSVRGVEFCRGLVERFAFHTYDNLRGLDKKRDPRRRAFETWADDAMAVNWVASKGDMAALLRLAEAGCELSLADYDGRTALHLAAAEGHADAVRLLLERGADADARDRWGHTPRDDAESNGHAEVVAALDEPRSSR